MCVLMKVIQRISCEFSEIKVDYFISSTRQ